MTFEEVEQEETEEEAEQEETRQDGIEREETRWDRTKNPKNTAVSKQEMEPGGNTVLLATADPFAAQSHLLKSLDPVIEDIPIPYFPFLIGKQEGIVDYVLGKDTVSRLHIRIDEEEGGCQVTDLNSSNGTIVAGHHLEANESRLISSGDKLQIADIPFIFY